MSDPVITAAIMLGGRGGNRLGWTCLLFGEDALIGHIGADALKGPLQNGLAVEAQGRPLRRPGERKSYFVQGGSSSPARSSSKREGPPRRGQEERWAPDAIIIIAPGLLGAKAKKLRVGAT